MKNQCSYARKKEGILYRKTLSMKVTIHQDRNKNRCPKHRKHVLQSQYQHFWHTQRSGIINSLLFLAHFFLSFLTVRCDTLSKSLNRRPLSPLCRCILSILPQKFRRKKRRRKFFHKTYICFNPVRSVSATIE